MRHLYEVRSGLVLDALRSRDAGLAETLTRDHAIAANPKYSRHTDDLEPATRLERSG